MTRIIDLNAQHFVPLPLAVDIGAHVHRAGLHEFSSTRSPDSTSTRYRVRAAETIWYPFELEARHIHRVRVAGEILLLHAGRERHIRIDGTLRCAG